MGKWQLNLCLNSFKTGNCDNNDVIIIMSYAIFMNIIINDSKFKNKFYEKCFYNAVYLGLLMVLISFRPIMN